MYQVQGIFGDNFGTIIESDQERNTVVNIYVSKLSS